MLGWLSEEAARASCLNRSRRPESKVNSGSRTLSATLRPSFVSWQSRPPPWRHVPETRESCNALSSDQRSRRYQISALIHRLPKEGRLRLRPQRAPTGALRFPDAASHHRRRHDQETKRAWADQLRALIDKALLSSAEARG